MSELSEKCVFIGSADPLHTSAKEVMQIVWFCVCLSVCLSVRVSDAYKISKKSYERILMIFWGWKVAQETTDYILVGIRMPYPIVSQLSPVTNLWIFSW